MGTGHVQQVTIERKMKYIISKVLNDYKSGRNGKLVGLFPFELAAADNETLANGNLSKNTNVTFL